MMTFINDESLKTRKRLNNEASLLHENRPTHDEVESVIDMLPLALSYKDDKGRLPVQSAIYSIFSAKFIPLLAEKGSSLDIGGAGMRGGLLCKLPGAKRNIMNAIQCFAKMIVSNTFPTTSISSSASMMG